MTTLNSETWEEHKIILEIIRSMIVSYVYYLFSAPPGQKTGIGAGGISGVVISVVLIIALIAVLIVFVLR